MIQKENFVRDLIEYCRANGGVEALDKMVTDKVIPKSVATAIRSAVENPKEKYSLTLDDTTKQLTVKDFEDYLNTIWPGVPAARINIKTGWVGEGKDRWFMEAWEIGELIMTGRAGGLMFIKNLKGYPYEFTLNGEPISKSDLFTKLRINEEA